MIGRAELELDLVIVTCAVSAGIHAALAPEHFREGAGAGTGFTVSAVALAVLAVALTRSATAAVLAGAAAVMAGLVVAYVLAVTTGVPVVHPEVEPVDGLALFTKAVELAGLGAAVDLLRHRAPRAVAFTRPKGSHA